MSAQPIPESIPAPSGARAPRKPSVLRSLPRPPHFKLARTPFLVVLAGLLALGMVGLLLLNTTLQAQAFRASELERHAAQLRYAEGEMEGKLNEAGSTRELSRKASELGMRPNFFVSYVVLPEGKIIGDPRPADDKFLSAALVRTPEQIAADRADAALKKAEERRVAETQILEKNKRKLEDARRKEAAKQAEEAKKAEQQAQAAQQPPAQRSGAQPQAVQQQAVQQQAVQQQAVQQQAVQQQAGAGGR